MNEFTFTDNELNNFKIPASKDPYRYGENGIKMLKICYLLALKNNSKTFSVHAKKLGEFVGLQHPEKSFKFLSAFEIDGYIKKTKRGRGLQVSTYEIVANES